ncbi:protein kinase [Cercopithecine alphaherpesvirus 9]|uniref:Protein kinase n=1 Tax=Cercopithecine herpesvirus 9 (strain DHV) TaxID=36348 RepID=Q9E1X3_CHV9D|nr:tegument serine/threonine protein kinase [Cercopithecine alphaherpesvirus 9]AAG27221.1 protein kinase [Cercopithecine alphaherpesvirus 9]
MDAYNIALPDSPCSTNPKHSSRRVFNVLYNECTEERYEKRDDKHTSNDLSRHTRGIGAELPYIQSNSSIYKPHDIHSTRSYFPIQKESTIPAVQTSIPWMFRISQLSRLVIPVYTVNPNLCFSTFKMSENPRFVGQGSYGRVYVYPSSKLALKTMENHSFTRELINTLVVSEAAIRCHKQLGFTSFITLLGFSLPNRQLLFPAYHMDLDEYTVRLSRRSSVAENIDRKLAVEFLNMAKGLHFLNRSCGLTHLDIKCGNIFVNVKNFSSLEITHAVIGDYSLITFNSYSLLSRARFEVGSFPRPQRVLRVNGDSSQLSFRLLLAHGTNQPPEVLFDYINGTGLSRYVGTLPQKVGLATDLYALGQALLEVILLGRISNQLPLSIHRTPHYYYYGHKLSPDLALDTLAYRVVLFPYIFTSPIPGNVTFTRYISAGEISKRVSRDSLRRVFQCHALRYGATHSKLFQSIRVPDSLNPAVVVATLLCHNDPKTRLEYPLLWQNPSWVFQTI